MFYSPSSKLENRFAPRLERTWETVFPFFIQAPLCFGRDLHPRHENNATFSRIKISRKKDVRSRVSRRLNEIFFERQLFLIYTVYSLQSNDVGLFYFLFGNFPTEIEHISIKIKINLKNYIDNSKMNHVLAIRYLQKIKIFFVFRDNEFSILPK